MPLYHPRRSRGPLGTCDFVSLQPEGIHIEWRAAVQVLPQLHIFSDSLLANAKRTHVLTQSRDPQLYKGMGCRNTSRGSDMSTGRTRVRSPTNVPASALPEEVQGLQQTQCLSHNSEDMEAHAFRG